MEYMNGIVKNIPMQNAKKPIEAPIKEIDNNPKMNKGCLETTTALDLIASIAFNCPKTMKGIVKNVKKDIVNEVSKPKFSTPIDLRNKESPELDKVIINVATIMLPKKGIL